MDLLFAHFTHPKVSPVDEASIPIIKGIKTVSRISYKPDVLSFALTSEYVPQLVEQANKFDLNWAQCCEKRISELEKAKGRIYIMWSGGIDSSVILVSILKFGSENLKSKVSIVLSTDSYREFPEMFRVICQQFPLISVYHAPESYMKSDDLLISGELGDQLFGSDFIYTLASHASEDSIFDSYKNQVPKLFKNLAGDKNGNLVYECLEPILNESPIKISSSFDYFWWWNFTQKWQHVKYRVLFLNFLNPSVYSKNVICFFDTPDFQMWSLTHHSEKIKADLNSYKTAAKNFIIHNTGFLSYADKPKIGSLKNIKQLRPRRWALYEDFSLCDFTDLNSLARNTNQRSHESQISTNSRRLMIGRDEESIDQRPS